MSTRLAWLLGVVVLVAMGLLVACGSKYSASSDGLVLVASQGSSVIQSFSFNLGNGHISGISNPPGTSSPPSAMVLDPAGAYAYVIIGGGAIGSFKINSNGTLTSVGTAIPDPNPVALAMDSAGKFLFVAEGLASVAAQNSAAFSTPCVQTQPPSGPAQYGVCVYAIGSGGSLTNVPNAYTSPTTLQVPNIVALAATPTVLPGSGPNGTQAAVCSSAGNNPPTTEYLYLADSVNNAVWEFVVDTSTGALTNPPNPGIFTAGSVPMGVVVDPCDRFVYVTNNQSNNISGFNICNGLTSQPSNCPATPDGSLKPMATSPFTLSGGSGPGPLAIDPFGNTLYVVETRSDQVSVFRISTVSGNLTAENSAATGRQPTAITIRADDNWLFVTNNTDGTLSQYSITPATGALSALPTVTTDTLPWGVAVK